MITLQNVYDAASPEERAMPLMVHAINAIDIRDADPVRSQTVVRDYVDGKQIHPAVLVLSDLKPEDIK